LRSNYNRTTWTGRMAFAWAGHGSHSSMLSKNVGSVWYSIASPDRQIDWRLSKVQVLKTGFKSCSSTCRPLVVEWAARRNSPFSRPIKARCLRLSCGIWSGTT
jgi:hypothetical protein